MLDTFFPSQTIFLKKYLYWNQYGRVMIDCLYMLYILRNISSFNLNPYNQNQWTIYFQRMWLNVVACLPIKLGAWEYKFKLGIFAMYEHPEIVQYCDDLKVYTNSNLVAVCTG